MQGVGGGSGALGAARWWKEGGEGRKVIGHLPVYCPREVIHAAGFLPVGIVGAGDLEIIRGDAYFQSYICRLPRSVIELGLSGRLDVLDGMAFPATCDVIRNLSGILDHRLRSDAHLHGGIGAARSG